MKRLLSIGLAVIAGLLVCTSVYATLTYYTYDYQSVVEADHGIYEYGCIPRPNADSEGGDWFILDNATHEPEGCTSINTYSDRIEVNLDNCLDEVITAYATVDEGFASQGVHVGLRMGLCEWTVYFFDEENNLLDPSEMSSSTQYLGGASNLWLWVRGED